MPRGLDEHGKSLIRKMCASGEPLTKEDIEAAIDKMAKPKFFNAKNNQEFSDELNECGFTSAAKFVAGLSD